MSQLSNDEKKSFRTCQVIERSGCWFCAMFDQCGKLEKGTPYSAFIPVADCTEYVPALNPPPKED